jgi:hypothetical protein
MNLRQAVQTLWMLFEDLDDRAWTPSEREALAVLRKASKYDGPIAAAPSQSKESAE